MMMTTTGKHTASKLFPLKSNQFCFLLLYTFSFMESTVECRLGLVPVT